MNDDFYVYELAYPEDFSDKRLANTVFYVGKGRNGRINAHEWEAKKGVQSPKCDVIRQILAEGKQVIKRKVHVNLPEQEAYFTENSLVLSYGYHQLTNKSGAIFMGNQNARGKRRKPLVLVSFSGKLRDQIEEAMLHDGIDFSRENFQEYVKKIVDMHTVD